MRQILRQLIHNIYSEMKLVNLLPETLQPNIMAGLTDAKDQAEMLLVENLIRCGDKEPLSDKEEIVFDTLQRHLRLSDELFAELTHEQKFSAARVIVHQGMKIRHPVATGHEYLGISFGHIFIGIEKDGYAHS